MCTAGHKELFIVPEVDRRAGELDGAGWGLWLRLVEFQRPRCSDPRTWRVQCSKTLGVLIGLHQEPRHVRQHLRPEGLDLGFAAQGTRGEAPVDEECRDLMSCKDPQEIRPDLRIHEDEGLRAHATDEASDHPWKIKRRVAQLDLATESLHHGLSSRLGGRRDQHAVLRVARVQLADQWSNRRDLTHRHGVEPQDGTARPLHALGARRKIRAKPSKALGQPATTPFLGQQNRHDDWSGQDQADVVSEIPHGQGAKSLKV